MAATTTYDVRLRYLMQDYASRGLSKLDRNLEKTARSTGILGRGLGRVQTAIVAAFGVRTAQKYLIDYNRQIEDATTTMAGLIDFTTKSGMDVAFDQAARSVKELEHYAKTSTATTGEMVNFARETVQPLLQAGLAAEKVSKFTARAVVAAKAFGDEQIAAFDIQQALTKGVEIRDRFMMKLLNAAKLTREEFNKMDTAGRLGFIEKMLDSPTIKNLAERQAQTFSGVFSTFQDNLEIIGGKLGKQVFSGLTKTLQQWNTWIDQNERKVTAWAKDLGEALVNAFDAIKGTAKFFVDNADLLMLIAKTWAAGKVGGMIGGGLVSGGDAFKRLGGAALSRNFTGVGLKLAKFGSTIATAGGLIAGLAGPIGLAAAALTGLWSWWQDKKREDAARAAAIDKAFKRIEHLAAQGPRADKAELPAAQADIARYAESLGLLRQDEFDNYSIRTDAFSPGSRAAADMSIDEWKRVLQNFEKFNDALEDDYRAQMALLRILDPDNERLKVAATPNDDDDQGGGDTNVTINRIEVESNDPDRFVFGLTEAIRDYRKNPSQSAFANIEGR